VRGLRFSLICLSVMVTCLNSGCGLLWISISVLIYLGTLVLLVPVRRGLSLSPLMLACFEICAGFSFLVDTRFVELSPLVAHCCLVAGTLLLMLSLYDSVSV
jgi:hypothetical protein